MRSRRGRVLLIAALAIVVLVVMLAVLVGVILDVDERVPTPPANSTTTLQT